MKIAIQAADLDAERIDGTRVYIKNMLKYFGTLDASSEFLIYHKGEFNPELAPPEFPNYEILKRSWPFFWTQLRLSLSIFKRKPDALWMPMHNIPYFISKNIKTSVTIHDLAFRYFPEMFTGFELWKLNFLTKMAVVRADKIITISESSKKDILKFFPEISQEKIKVISHGFDQGIFSQERDICKEDEMKRRLGINGKYILYVGAIQPRKNLGILIEAFEKIRSENVHDGLKLVLAGGKAWMWESVFEKIEKSPWKEDIVTPGKIDFKDLGHLMRGAEAFCYPSLYEGFGIPILEAFAAKVPVICSDNSSLPEVGGGAAMYFNGKDYLELFHKIIDVLDNGDLRAEMIAKGLEQIKKFSWERCAKETLEYIKS